MAYVGGARLPAARTNGNGGAQYRPPQPKLPTPLRPLKPIAIVPRGVRPGVAPKPTQLNSSPAPGAPPSASPQTPGSPFDAAYFNARAQDQFKSNQQIANLNAQGGYANTALQENLRQMATQEPLIEQNATNAANAKGLLYSGNLGNQIGTDKTAYTQKQTQAKNQFAQGQASRQSQIAGLHAQYDSGGFADLAEQLAAINRASAAAQTAPLATAPVSKPAVKAPPGHVVVQAHTRAKPVAKAKPSTGGARPPRGLR